MCVWVCVTEKYRKQRAERMFLSNPNPKSQAGRDRQKIVCFYSTFTLKCNCQKLQIALNVCVCVCVYTYLSTWQNIWRYKAVGMGAVCGSGFMTPTAGWRQTTCQKLWTETLSFYWYTWQPISRTQRYNCSWAIWVWAGGRGEKKRGKKGHCSHFP